MGPHDTASDVEVQEGLVMVNGPDGIAYMMTPAAAHLTAERLHAAADEAARQVGRT
jgi:uncharacterized protein YjeT (DUF2065 family)